MKVVGAVLWRGGGACSDAGRDAAEADAVCL